MGLELRKPPNICTGRGRTGRAFVCPWLCGFLSDLLEGDMESGVPSWAGDLCFGLFLEAFLPRVREPQSRFSPVVSLP